jgi:hypothetical protein
MSDKKISELTALTAPDGAEELVVNDSGTSKKITQTNLLSTALPLAGGTMTGTIAGFTSTGIDDNATSTAITINASEQVIIGDTDANVKSALTVSSNASGNAATFIHDGSAGTYFDIDCGAAGGSVDLRADAVSGAYPALTFKTSASERMRIEAGGNVEVSTGNLVIGTSGKGIDFSAVSDGSRSVSSNILDDYETGTWTPKLCLWDGTVFHTATDQGYYVKVGSLVYITIRIYNATTTTNGTVLKIKNLPYASGGDNNQSASPLVYSSGTGNAVKATIVDGADYIGLSDTHDGFSNVLASEIGSGARIYTSLTYTTI